MKSPGDIWPDFLRLVSARMDTTLRSRPLKQIEILMAFKFNDRIFLGFFGFRDSRNRINYEG